jgi:hypothetical protein
MKLIYRMRIMRLLLLLKTIVLLCIIQLLFVEVQSAQAQGGDGQPDGPEFSNCDTIPAPDCQITVTSDQYSEPVAEYWRIQLDEDDPFSPTHVQTDELPASIAIVVDGSDVMRIGLLTQVFDLLSGLDK